MMSALPTDAGDRIIRAFSYFSHLANIAEDQHHIRRTPRPRHGRRAAAARQHGLRAGRARRTPASRASSSRLLRRARSAPVLTAHPTEVQRKSILDGEREIARLLDERDRVRSRRRSSHDNRARCAATC